MSAPTMGSAATTRGVEATVASLAAAGVAGRIAAKDPDVWGPDASDEAAVRLGWTDLHETSRPLVARIAALRAELAAEGIDRVVLCGMGGSSLAPEVICAAANVPLVVLDATDPSQVRDALVELDRTVVVVSSKSGSTVETDSQRRVFVEAFDQSGIDPASRIVAVTDPGSGLEQIATDGGYRAVFLADATVGGRYSALTAFGLVPSGLAGADIAGLLDQAAAVSGACASDSPDNPALRLGAVMAATPGSDTPRDKIVIVAGDGPALPGFGDWAEQLIAESTGKLGRGVLPIAAGPDAPELSPVADDVVVAQVSGGAAVQVVSRDADVSVTGPLGGQFLLWEYATVVAGHLLGINPFDQPDVESAKIATRGLLDATPQPLAPAFVADGVSVTASAGLLDGVPADLGAAIDAVLARLGPHGYVAVMAYVNRLTNADLSGVRDSLARRTGRPVTFGWGPRFLHSTGQFHKGGPAVGVFVQIVGGAGLVEDLEIPERPFTFGRLLTAQAAGDAGVLASHDVPVLTFTVSDAAGLRAARTALTGRAL